MFPAERAVQIHRHRPTRRVDLLAYGVEVRPQAVEVHRVLAAHRKAPAAIRLAPVGARARLANETSLADEAAASTHTIVASLIIIIIIVSGVVLS